MWTKELPIRRCGTSLSSATCTPEEKCRDCFARFYCSGGCAANAYNFSGDITGAYEIGCAMQKKRIECAIMIRAALAEDGE